MLSLRYAHLWLFFALAYGVSWCFWISAALLGRHVSTFPGTLLFLLGGLGPLLAGVLLAYLTNDQEGWRDYWRRVVDFKRIGAGWYAVILLTVPLLTAGAVALEILSGGSLPQPEAAARFLSQPLTILPSVVFALILGPLPEELGWRGYALDRLQARLSALISSLVLGTLWAIWHLPLFFITGTYQNGLGFGSLPFWVFMVGPIPVSVLMTWIYNNTHRSTLSAILFHFMINVTGNLSLLPERTQLYRLLLWIVVAAGVVLLFGPKTLRRRP